ncbi:hypothetical protein [Ancylobacter pratisalsi]|uniref:Toprim domain-containing protein n=1 Tax=Ancylobacter pratisalsi TaxID=1745854 RepID=A0A6P1YN89_9HYPH|nr:hypothetical protein [Ancylobacter pratisalsi]QIB34522.1 hypothetical protein G3A50_12980 [Ancylobacter pratisalsi]
MTRRLDFIKFFVGADVVILPDNDQAGREHAEMAARALKPVASRIRIVELPDLPRKGDVTDWLDAGGTVEKLHRLINLPPRSASSPNGDIRRVRFPPLRRAGIG